MFIKPVFAQEICNPVLPWTCSQSGENMLGKIISSSLAFILVIASILAFFFLVLGGIQWITSGGDKAGLEAARNRIMHAVIGLILVAASWAIMTFVFQWLGISFPTFSIPTISQSPPGGGTGIPSDCVKNDACAIELERPTACSSPRPFCRKFDGVWACCPN